MTDTSYDTFLDFFPVLSPTLWHQISHRFYATSIPYMRKLGVVGKTSVPCRTIDAFFTVETCVRQETQNDEWVVRFIPAGPLSTTCHPVFPEMCPLCQSTLLNDPRKSQVVCMTCGESTACVFSPEGPFDSRSVTSLVAHHRRITTYMYKRTNHFLDHLKRVQAKEATSVQPNIMNAVKNELAKEHIYHSDPRITITKVRSILKKLRLQKYYNHVFAITANLSGKKPPQLTAVQEEKLLAMFQAIQGPFERHCPPDRTNMISYSYVLRKLVEILGWNHLIGYFPLLKSRQKVYNQDCIWRNICEEVGFPYYRSIS